MKKKFTLITIVFVSLFLCANVKAMTYARITSATATTFTGPANNYSKGAILKYNDVVPILNTTVLKSSKGCSSGFYKANINGSVKYLCKHDTSTSNITVKAKDSSTNIRTGAGTKYSTYQTSSKNKIYTLDNNKKYSGSGCSAGWFRLNYNYNSNKYICSSFTKEYNSISNYIVMNTKSTTIRKSATSSSKAIVTLKYGQAVTLYNTTKYKGSGCSAGWYKAYYGNTIGYICSTDIVRTDRIYVVNDTEGVNVRTSANSSSSKVSYMNYLEPVMLANNTKYSGSGCSAGWYKIRINNRYAYVCSTYIASDNNITLINKDNTEIKKGASSSNQTILKLNKNKSIILTSTNVTKGSGCTNGWYKVRINGQNGYVCSDNTELGINIFGKPKTTNNTTTTTTTNTTTSSSNSTKKITSVKTSSSVYYTTNKWTYRLKENYGNVRNAANTSSSIQNVIYLGTELDVLGSSAATSGCSAGWYKVKYWNNKTGYVCKSLVEKYSDVTKSDSSYCNTLKNAGFPASYCPYLSYLHSKHSNWVFKAEKTGVSFLAAVNGESERNYTQISTAAKSYLQSTAVREAGSWRTASDAYVAYMLDPRNYLNEQNIFAFENLSYDSKYHTTSAIRSIVSGTYLDTNGYANNFLDAAKTYKVSPIHLAARVKQEGGANSSYDAVSGKASGSCNVNAYVCASYAKLNSKKTGGTLTDNVNLRSGAGTNNYILTEGLKNESFTIVGTFKTYKGSGCNAGWYNVKINRSLKGMYNYYNIGSYGSNPVVRGLQAAAGCVDVNDGTPWNTRAKAIKYGAAFIANGYINKGQDTMYYQKFNTGPKATSTRYTHQYMTNILAPASESLSTYNSYNNLKTLNKAYVFKIPVYNSMPSEFTTHPPVK